MKKQIRFICMLLIIVVVGSAFAGCGSSTVKSDSTADAAAVATTATTAAAAESTANNPITLKMYINPGPFPMTPGVQDDPVAKEIERVTGVTMDIETVDNDKTKVMVASGDLSDLFAFSDVTYVDPMIKAGSIMPLDKYIVNSENIKKNADMSVKYSKENLSGGTGNLYVFLQRAKKNPSPVATSQNGVFLRWDYYKELGMPKLNTPDDLVTVVSQMLEKHPTNADGKKNYGFSTHVQWGIGFGYGSSSYATKYSGLYGLPTGFAYFNTVNNEYISLLDDRNNFWKGTAFLNKAYNAGVLDPESFTQKFETLQQKFDDGRVMCSFAEWLITKANTNLAASTNGNASYVDIPMPDTSEYTSWYSRQSPFGMTGRMFAVSSKCKYPQKAVDLIDYLYSEEGSRTILTGVKGRTWTDEGGKKKVTTEALNNSMTNADYRAAEGIHKYEGIVGLDYDSLDENGQFIDLFLEPDTAAAAYTSAQKEYIAYYGAKDLLDVIGKRENKSTVNEGITALCPPLTPDINRISSKVDSYLNENFVKLVMTKNDAAYKAMKESIITDINKMGFDQLDSFSKDGFLEAVKKWETYK
jgi:putative aldouronate transport system substrate-binding protein